MNDPVSTQKTTFTRMRRASAFIGAGLLAGLVAAAIGGVASAQTVIDDTSESAPVTHIVRSSLMQIEEAEPGDDYQPSAEEEAAFERFEQCLQDAGVDIESEGEATEPDEAMLDAAFEQCDPILEELGEEFFGEFDELSAEDEAVFEQYDTCVENAGLSFELEGDEDDLDEAVVDAAFEQCDPILDGLSEEAQELFGEFDEFGELSAEDEAVFEQYDTCLENAGLDFESGEDGVAVDIDEAALDAAFEQCDPILDGLSEEAQELFEFCPEDE